MKNQDKIQELLNEVQQVEGASFTAQIDAIFAAYSHKNTEKSTLAIKILSIFGGFLGMVTFVAFLMLAGLYDSSIGMTLFGLIFIAGAIIVNKVYDRLIIDTASIAGYITGISLLAFGLGAMQTDENLIAAICMLIAIVTMFVSQAYMLAFISILVINGSILFFILQSEVFLLFNLYIAFLAGFITFFITQESSIITFSAKMNKLYEPIKIALILIILFVIGFVSKENLYPKKIELMWLPSLVSLGCIFYIVSTIINVLKIDNPTHKTLIYVASGLTLLPTIFAPAIACAILVLLLCFLTNYKTGFAISIIAFIYFIGQYYYDLNLTLLTKSIVLMVSGVLLLLFYYLISVTYRQKS